MAGAKTLALWLVLAILASNPPQAVANCKRKCIGTCKARCCIKNDTPCTFYATALGQNITVNNVCTTKSDPLLANPPWW